MSETHVQCTVGQFMKAYPTLPMNLHRWDLLQPGEEVILRHPLPKRGDLVRLLRRKGAPFRFISQGFIIQLVN